MRWKYALLKIAALISFVSFCLYPLAGGVKGEENTKPVHQISPKLPASYRSPAADRALPKLLGWIFQIAVLARRTESGQK